MISNQQKQTLHDALLALRAELAQMVASSADAAAPVGLDEPIGRLSRMDAMQQQSMAAANRRAAQLRQQQVEAALVRFDGGAYGDCLECGEPIEIGRLTARPETPFCITCQGKREQRR